MSKITRVTASRQERDLIKRLTIADPDNAQYLKEAQYVAEHTNPEEVRQRVFMEYIEAGECEDDADYHARCAYGDLMNRLEPGNYGITDSEWKSFAHDVKYSFLANMFFELFREQFRGTKEELKKLPDWVEFLPRPAKLGFHYPDQIAMEVFGHIPDPTPKRPLVINYDIPGVKEETEKREREEYERDMRLLAQVLGEPSETYVNTNLPPQKMEQQLAEKEYPVEEDYQLDNQYENYKQNCVSEMKQYADMRYGANPYYGTTNTNSQIGYNQSYQQQYNYGYSSNQPQYNGGYNTNYNYGQPYNTNNFGYQNNNGYGYGYNNYNQYGYGYPQYNNQAYGYQEDGVQYDAYGNPIFEYLHIPPRTPESLGFVPTDTRNMDSELNRRIVASMMAQADGQMYNTMNAYDMPYYANMVNPGGYAEMQRQAWEEQRQLEEGTRSVLESLFRACRDEDEINDKDLHMFVESQVNPYGYQQEMMRQMTPEELEDLEEARLWEELNQIFYENQVGIAPKIPSPRDIYVANWNKIVDEVRKDYPLDMTQQEFFEQVGFDRSKAIEREIDAMGKMMRNNYSRGGYGRMIRTGYQSNFQYEREARRMANEIAKFKNIKIDPKDGSVIIHAPKNLVDKRQKAIQNQIAFAESVKIKEDMV